MTTPHDLTTLTDRQADIYHYILRSQYEHGWPPTIREIGGHFDIKSPNGVICHLKALQKKGFVEHVTRASARGWAVAGCFWIPVARADAAVAAGRVAVRTPGLTRQLLTLACGRLDGHDEDAGDGLAGAGAVPAGLADAGPALALACST